jgi:hypothetical protein
MKTKTESLALLQTALTRFDSAHRERTGGNRTKGYNPYALGIYFERAENVAEDISRGAEPRKAICAGFTGPVASACLKVFGLTAWKKEDEPRTAWGVYVPAHEGFAKELREKEERESENY